MIEKMKFLSITGPKADIDRMTETYLSKYEIHLEKCSGRTHRGRQSVAVFGDQPLQGGSEYHQQLLRTAARSPEDHSPAHGYGNSCSTIRRIQKESEDLEAEREKLAAEHAGMVDSLKIIRPFRDLDFDVSEILRFQYIHYRFGRIEKQYLQKFEKYIYDNLDTIFIKCGDDEQYVYGVLFRSQASGPQGARCLFVHAF